MRQINLYFDSKDAEIYNEVLIRKGENLATELLITIPANMVGYKYLLQFELPDNSLVHTEELFPNGSIISYTLSSVFTANVGDIKIQLQAYETISPTSEMVMKSPTTRVKAYNSMIVTDPILPEDYAPWYTKAASFSGSAEQSAESAKTSETNAKASEVNAGTSATNALNSANSASTSATNANNSAVIAEQKKQETITLVDNFSTAEDTRVANENTRIQSETARNFWDDYDAGVTYAVGNKVAYNGSSYVCLASCVNILPTNNTYWLLIAQKGTDGVVTINDNAVTNAKLSDVATATIKGRATAGTGNPEDLTASQVRTLLNLQRGVANGVAELNESGFVVTAQLPSYVDDVIEGTLATFPATGETGKIYVDTTSGKTYRWSGSAYSIISDTIALGETSATAYRGDRGATAYTHSQSAHASTSSITDVVQDTTPQLGGELDQNGHTIGGTEYDNGSSGTSKTINWKLGNHQKVLMTGNCTFAFTAPSKPCMLSLKITQDTTGSRTIALPTIKWAGATAPVWSTTANAIDILTLYYDGSSYYGQAGINFG